MPVYLVRWPDLSASLVRAGDEQELLDILDQVANPESCEWSVYEGPLFIDFRLPAQWSVQDSRSEEPVTPAQIIIDDIGRMATEPAVGTMEVALAQADAGSETGNEVLRLAFPELHAAIEKMYEDDEAMEREALPESDIRTALHSELVRFLHASWRRAQLQTKNDPVSVIARELDMPVPLVQRLAKASAELPVSEEDTPDTLGADPLTMRAPLFGVSNHHTNDCGKAPAGDGDASGCYYGYFANEHGDQAVYEYDQETAQATVRMGDSGWQNVHRVVDGCIQDVTVTDAEATWIRACWLATCSRKRP